MAMTPEGKLLRAFIKGRQARWYGYRYNLADMSTEEREEFLKGWQDADQIDKDIDDEGLQEDR